MNAMQPIPGSFTDEDSKRIRWAKLDTINIDGIVATRYTADAKDGMLKAILSRDQIGDGFLWHLSVSGPNRLPSWDELKSAKYRLLHEDIPMVLIFPRRAAPYVNLHEFTLHLYESTEKGIDE